MSIFSALFEQGKVYNFEQAFGVKDITSTAMQAAIKDWAQLYYQTEPTQDEDPCQRIPVSVVAKLTKTTFSEYKAVPTKQGAEYIDTLLRELDAAKVKMPSTDHLLKNMVSTSQTSKTMLLLNQS